MPKDEKEYTHSHQARISDIPRICEEVFRSKCKYPDAELHKEEPNEEIIDKIHKFGLIEKYEGCVDTRKYDDRGDYQLIAPMFYLVLEMELLIHVSSQFNPVLNIMEIRREHGGVFEQDLAELHELVNLLNHVSATM